jgi:mono/diheme cytochrome c family protein
LSWRSVVGVAVATTGALATGVMWTARSDQPAPATASTALAGVDGPTLFRNKGCAACHGDPEDEATGGPCPDLSDVREWAGERRSGMSAEDYLAESIREPAAFMSPAFRPGGNGPVQAMPELDVSEEEIDALVAYLLEG